MFRRILFPRESTDCYPQGYVHRSKSKFSCKKKKNEKERKKESGHIAERELSKCFV